jgi:hypothetical protein
MLYVPYFFQVLEQVEGGDLVVNRGNESRPKEGASDRRDLNVVDGYDEALKVSQVCFILLGCRKMSNIFDQVNIEDVIKRNIKATETVKNPNIPTTHSDVYLRIQPYSSAYSQPPSLPEVSAGVQQQLQFLIYFFDPVHKLVHTTVTQTVPIKWLPLWDEYDWVEDLIADTLRAGVEVIGQEYVVARMGWGSKEEHSKENSTSVDPEEKENITESS